MNFLFLMDPLNTVVMDKDTSFILMLAASRRGHKVYYLPNDGITRKNGKLYFDVIEVTPQLVKDKPFVEHQKVALVENEIDVVFIRSDPPFDQEYLTNTLLLDLLPSSIPVINSSSGVRTVNEKLWATQFTSIVPRTLVSSKKDQLLKFLDEEKDIIIKPTDGHGGKGVFHVKKGDENTNVIIEMMTVNGNRPAIAQQYVPQAKDGDKRILLFNGEPLGAVLRVHAQDDHRNNIFAGGKCVATEITKRDQEIIEILKPELRKLGLYFVGIDIMGEYLIEVNVTSPTCLQEMNQLYKVQLEDKVIDFVEKLIDQSKHKDRIHA